MQPTKVQISLGIPSLNNNFVINYLNGIFIPNFKPIITYCGLAGSFESYLEQVFSGKGSNDSSEILKICCNDILGAFNISYQ